jgi:hypothetical protein
MLFYVYILKMVHTLVKDLDLGSYVVGHLCVTRGKYSYNGPIHVIDQSSHLLSIEFRNAVIAQDMTHVISPNSSCERDEQGIVTIRTGEEDITISPPTPA